MMAELHPLRVLIPHDSIAEEGYTKNPTIDDGER